MKDENETITVEMLGVDRMKLQGQINDRMVSLGYRRYDYDKLNLGFHLPQEWPLDKDAQPTLAQLLVVAMKLRMRIIISNLDMVARREKTNDDSDNRPIRP